MPDLISTPITPDLVRGAAELEVDTIAKRRYPGLPPRPDGSYDLVVDGELHGQARVAAGDTITVDLATGTTDHETGEPGTVSFRGLPETAKDVELWLPHNETTELVALRSDASLAPRPGNGVPRWLHHGSSISQGSNAAHPTGTWPVVAARRAGINLVNLGLAGSALLDPFVARIMRDIPAELISLKSGINLVNADLLRRRALGPALHGFLDTLRAGHPDTPLLLVSPLFCPIHEKTPGPGAFDPDLLRRGIVGFRATGDPAEVPAGRLTLEVVREELDLVVAQRADPRLELLDGRKLYGEGDHHDHPLPDRLHPDGGTHQRIGRRFADLALAGRTLNGPLQA